MDPIAVDVPKLSSFSKPAAPVRTEPAKPPFTPAAAPAADAGATSLTGKIAEALGLRKNGKILAAAGCSLLIGYAAVKYLAPKPPAEASQPLVADAKKPQEPVKPAEEKPSVPPAIPAVVELRSTEPLLPTAPSGFVIPPTSPVPPLSPSSSVSLPTIPASPPSLVIPAAIPATLPPSAPDSFVPAGTSKAIAPPSIPEIAPPSFGPPTVVPVSGVELPKVPASPMSPAVPTLPPTSPIVPELPGIPPPAAMVPPVLPTVPTTPPATLPMTPPSIVPPAITPPSLTPPSSVLPPAVLPTMPEPSKPLTIDYTKPAYTADVKPTILPDRAASTTFDVDLYEPTRNDSYNTICKEFYNDAKYASALAEYNGRRQLQGGVRVEVPPIHVLKKRFPQLIGLVVPASGTSSVLPASKPVDPWVSSGENTPAFRPTGARSFTVPAGGLRMGEIARITLGDPKHWSGIYDLNPQLSPSDLLPAGTVVKIPADAK